MVPPHDAQKARIAELIAADPQLTAALPLDSVNAAVRRPGLRLAELFETFMEGYAERPALGWRRHEVVLDPATGRRSTRLLRSFATITYGELWDRAGAVAAQLAGDASAPTRPGDFICVLGFASADYALLDIAGIRLGAVTVPLPDGSPTSQLTAIAQETQPVAFATNVDSLAQAVEVAVASESVRRVVVFDYHPQVDDAREAVEAARLKLAGASRDITLDALDDVLERGKALPVPRLPDGGEGTQTLATLFYTSGSTGAPKGAMYPEWLVTALIASPSTETDIASPSTEIDIASPQTENDPWPNIVASFLPLSHTIGYRSVFGTLTQGGTAYFVAKSDLSTFFEDLALIRPTIFSIVPRICEMLWQHYQGEVAKRAGDGDRAQVEEEVKARLREQLLGGRVIDATSGSAPLSAELHEFMQSLLQVQMTIGYGSTELIVHAVDGVIPTPPVIAHKLVDVPELGYFSTDIPHPRGELLLKSVYAFPGYYKRPDVTAEVFDEDGFYRTGDVVVEVSPGRIIVIDRRKNVLKLSQGEFVAVANLETAFAVSPLVRQIYVYGSSERSHLLAVVVPTPEALERHGAGEAVKAVISESLQQIAKEHSLKPYEIPRDFIIETEPFTAENGLLAGPGKVLRPRLKERYAECLEQLYTDIAQGQSGELREIRAGVSARPVLETVQQAAGALLGASGSEVGPEAHFTDLGGDSLAALTFSNLLHELFEVDVPVGVIVSAANNLRAVAEHVEKERASGGAGASFASVHGAGSAVIRAGDLTLDKFIDPKVLAAAKSLPRPAGAVRTVLLTGANGWLGRFLALEWLERLAPGGGKLVVVVRGKDAAAARARLDAVFDSGDPALLARYQELAESTLEVLAGDLSEPGLGLDAATWERLAEEVDLISHPGALVNHVLPYSQLFGPNVVGTAEVIRLAVTTKLKPVTYLSTVTVAAGIETAAFEEDGDIRTTSAQRSVDEGYANGYANSKWAGEVLLREAHEHTGLPVRVFRSDMILAHHKYSGQVNVSDVFTRLVLSVLATGIAPKSFYQLDAQGQRQRGHYAGIPVDFTAEAVTTLGAEAFEDYHSYNTFNPHQDGIGYDEFIDWLVEAGHSICRIDDYAEWLTRFETALRGLPEQQRQHSALPLLHAFAQPGAAMQGSPFHAENFRGAVQTAKIGADHDIPHLSKELIVKYATDLKSLGLL